MTPNLLKNDLESETRKEEAACKEAQEELNEQIDTLMAEREAARASIAHAKKTIDSFRRSPSDIKAKSKEVAKQQKSFDKSDELARKQFQQEAAVKGAGVLALGGIAALAWFLRETVEDLFKRKRWFIGAVVAIAAFIVMAVSKLWSLFRRKEANEWSKLLKQFQEEHASLNRKVAATKSKAAAIRKRRAGLEGYLTSFDALRGLSFKDLSPEQQRCLYSLANDTLALANALNEETMS